MDTAYFLLDQIGVTKRFRVFLKDENDAVIMTGQLRELKPMCLDEIKLIRSVAEKDNSFERAHTEKGHFYILRARDAHELGRGNYYDSPEMVEREVELVKKYAVNAKLIDKTPAEERVRAKEYIDERNIEVLAEKGMKLA